jgi:hypothetical protein
MSLLQSWRGGAARQPTPPTPGESFHVHPNPHETTATKHRFATSNTQLAAAAAGVVVGATILWKLYRRWKSNPQHPSFHTRMRLQQKLTEIDSEEVQLRPSWLYRLFFRADSPTPNSHAAKRRKKQASGVDDDDLKRRSSSPTKVPKGAGPTFAPSAAQQLTSTERFRLFLAEAKQLADHHAIVISDPTTFYLKRERMRESNRQRMRASASGREGNVHIVSAFDRTLTTHRLHQHQHYPPTPTGSQPTLSMTSQSLLSTNLPSSYGARMDQLFKQYYPQERSQHVSPAEKAEYMREWWMRSHALLSLDEYRLTRNKLRQIAKTAVETGAFQLRGSVMELLRQSSNTQDAGLCQKYNIPIVILSSSICDCIEELLLQHDIRVWNTNSDLTHANEAERQRYAESNVLLVANRIRWSVPPAQTSVMDLAASMPNLSSSSTSSIPVSSTMSPSALLRRTAHHRTHSSTSSSFVSSSCLGFDHGHLVHSLNKSYVRILEQAHLLERLRGKENIVLIGNTVHDASMLAEGAEQRESAWEESRRQQAGEMHQEEEFDTSSPQPPQQQQLPQPRPVYPASPHRAPSSITSFDDLAASYRRQSDLQQRLHQQSQSTYDLHSPSTLHAASSSSSFDILRIGFLNSDVTPERLAAFTRVYDVVLCGDQGFEYVREVVGGICGEEDDAGEATPPTLANALPTQRNQHAQ